VSWWAWLLVAALLGLASLFCAMLSLSAGTAYGTEYHTLTARQRTMARMLGVGSLAAALLCGAAALALLAAGLRAAWLLL
jgi:hypothetical protein